MKNVEEETPEERDENAMNSNATECSICYEDLSAHSVAALLISSTSKKRSCPHYFHKECIVEWKKHAKTCPIDRIPFSSILPIPNPYKNISKWFEAVDSDGDGYLTRSEVLKILEAQIPLDIERLTYHADRLWKEWDPNGDGKISFTEFKDQDRGLIQYIKSNFPVKPRAQIPDIQKDMRAWFNFWDADGNGNLDKSEVVRALAKTFIQSNKGATLHVLRDFKEHIWQIWNVFDTDGNGTISLTEFCQPDGLGETICSTFAQDSVRS